MYLGSHTASLLQSFPVKLAAKSGKGARENLVDFEPYYGLALILAVIRHSLILMIEHQAPVISMT